MHPVQIDFRISSLTRPAAMCHSGHLKRVKAREQKHKINAEKNCGKKRVARKSHQPKTHRNNTKKQQIITPTISSQAQSQSPACVHATNTQRKHTIRSVKAQGKGSKRAQLYDKTRTDHHTFDEVIHVPHDHQFISFLFSCFAFAQFGLYLSSVLHASNV